MLAIAFVKTPDGRRWAARRGVFFFFLGTIPFTIGRLIGEPLLMWLGGALFAKGLWNLALPYLPGGYGMLSPSSAERRRQRKDGSHQP
jgi:hypothetical protein